MTDQQFCEIETAISGEPISHIDQLEKVSFTGRELKEYLEDAIIISNTNLPVKRDQFYRIYFYLVNLIAIGLLIFYTHNLFWKITGTVLIICFSWFKYELDHAVEYPEDDEL